MAIIQYKTGASLSSQTSVTTTLDAAATAGSLLVAIHRFSTNVTNMVTPTDFAVRRTEARSTFMGLSASTKPAVGGETTFTASTTAVSAVNCLQELLVLELGEGAWDTDAGNQIGAVTSISAGPTPTLAAGTKLILAVTGTVNASGGFGAAPTDYTKLGVDEPTNTRLTCSYKEVTTTTGESATQTWTTSGGAAIIVASLTETAAPAWAWSHNITAG